VGFEPAIPAIERPQTYALDRKIIGMGSLPLIFITLRPVDVGFLVDKVSLGQVSISVLQFSPVSIIPLILQLILHSSTTDAV
jgi:hypothetical protein